MSDKVIVRSFDGLYDVVAEATMHHINTRKRCLKHNFINASLYWESAHDPDDRSHWSIDLREQEEGFGGTGRIRFCVNCKMISCMHKWEDPTTTYVLEHGKFYQEEIIVGKCARCGLRVMYGGCGVCKPTPDAWNVIDTVAKEMGRRSPSLGHDAGYGSGWLCELPVAVSQILDAQGEQAAKDYVRGCFDVHSCQDAMNRVMR